MFVTEFVCLFLKYTTLNFRGRSKKKNSAGDVRKGTLNIEFEADQSVGLGATLRDRQKIKNCFSSFKDFFRERPIVSHCWVSNVL